MEEGDTRYRPAAWLICRVSENWSGAMHFWGRKQGTVLQQSYLMTVARSYPLFSSKYFRGEWGLAMSYDRNRIQRISGDAGRSVEINRNLGLHLGFSWRMGTKLNGQFQWGSNIFPAGIAGIFLATARKQDLSLGVGWNF